MVLTTRDILEKLVSFDSTSRNPNLPILDWIQTYLAAHGVESRRIFDETGTKANLWATIGPQGQGGYILSGHTDVVPVDGQAWMSDPFTLMERDGKLHGRGTCDMKGFLACCLAAVPRMVSANLATPLHLAFSYDEEAGCIGVRRLIEELTQLPNKPLGCFVGEPTSMQVIIGHKNKRFMRTTIRGRAAHSSLSPEGVNAVEWGARLVAHIRNVADEYAVKGSRDPLYPVQFTTIHVGVMHGGVALNIVPDECVIIWEVRSVAEDDPDEIVAGIEQFAREQLEPAMRAVAPEAGISFVRELGSIGLETAPDADIVTFAKRIAGRNDHGKVSFGTEAGLFVRDAGIPSVVIGPGSIDQAHKPNEFITIDQLNRCDEFIGRLIEELSA